MGGPLIFIIPSHNAKSSLNLKDQNLDWNCHIQDPKWVGIYIVDIEVEGFC